MCLHGINNGLIEFDNELRTIGEKKIAKKNILLNLNESQWDRVQIRKINS